MEILRTPPERFRDLPDWPYTARFTEVADPETGLALRYAVVDEGPADAAPVLLLHGNPSWSYLHRRMIRGLVERGHRVVAVDLMGLGQSDKPDDPAFYTLARHVDWMSQLVAAEDLRDITLFCQDWGGTIGLNVLRVEEDRFSRVVASNTGLPVGEGVNRFMRQWLEFSQSVDWSNTLVIPVPRDLGTFKEVTVDGVPGTLVWDHYQPGDPGYMLMWVKDGVVYGLSGQGEKEEALQIANSLK